MGAPSLLKIVGAPQVWYPFVSKDTSSQFRFVYDFSVEKKDDVGATAAL
jgi:hypothetical protein